VSFIKRAREAAEAAAEQAQHAAGMATKSAADPATQEKLGQQARAAMGAARRGVSTVVERIDPGVLAELVIKATALQELTNRSLREKKSPYRIAEVSITASIPAELVDELHETGEAVISLDGTTLTHDELTTVDDALAQEIPEDLNRP
jgi:hypothetical protein